MLKDTGDFGPVPDEILQDGRRIFESDRVSDQQTLENMEYCYKQFRYILDPHSAVGVTGARRSISRTSSHIPHISMSTAHPANFSQAVKLALKDEYNFNFEKSTLPPELDRLAQMEKRFITVENSFKTVREIIKRQVLEDMRKKGSS